MKLFDKLVVCELSVVRYPAMVVDLTVLGIIEVVVNGDSKPEIYHNVTCHEQI